MIIPLKLEGYKKYLEIIRILSNLVDPYTQLRNREMQVLAILYYFYNEKYAYLNEEDKNIMIFSFGRKDEIVDILSEGEEKISKKVIYDIMKDLRKKGLIGSKEMIPGKVLPNIKELTFKFQ